MATKTYNLYANILTFIHAAWTLLLLGGAGAVFWYPAYAPIQIAIMTFTLVLAIPFGNTCPLTLLEEKLRRKVDPGYHNDGSYIAAHLNSLFKANIPVSRVNKKLAGLYILSYAAAIAILIIRQ